MSGRHEQRQDRAQQGQPGQDVEDGVELQAGGDQEAAEQRAADTAQPAAFDIMSEHVGPEAVREAVRVSAHLEQHVEWLQEYAELGFDDIYLHFVGQEQERFLDVFGEQVLPQLTRPSPPGPAAP